MRIALHDFGGYPFTAQLASALARRGHEVVYLHAAGFRQPRSDLASLALDAPTLEVRGVSVGGPYRRDAGLRRLVQERSYGRLLADSIRRVGPDVVISANCPLDAQASALEATHRAGGAFVFWLQDLYSIAVTRLLRRRLGLLAGTVGGRYARLERSLLQRADAVIPISPDFEPTLRSWRVPPGRVRVIQNWAPIDARAPLGRDNHWSRRYGLSQETLIYAGTLGRKHDHRQLVALAHGLPHARVVVVAEGAGADALRTMQKLPGNLTLLPLQQAGDLPAVLASADVLVALLERDSHEFSVPSKVLTYLAAGRPIVAAVPRDNLAARTIVEAGAGIVVDPGDARALAAAAESLLGDPSRRQQAGAAARAYAERAFDIVAKTDAFEDVLERVTRPVHAGTVSADTEPNSPSTRAT